MNASCLASLLVLALLLPLDVCNGDKGVTETKHEGPKDLSDVELESGDDSEDSEADSQHIFPSFPGIFPPLGHSRPSFYPEPSAGYQVDAFRYTPRSNPLNHKWKAPTPFGQQPASYGRMPPLPAKSNLFSSGVSDDSDGVLGSGNFGVIRGGTYYSGLGDEQGYTRGNNAHSRPYRRPNPPPLYRGGGDFFQGFRDFADITTPSKAAYSQYVVVYANRKGNTRGVVGSPRNIMEQLELLEAEDKKSKAKRKLDAYKEKERATEQRKKVKSPKEQLEPLLALS